MNSDEYQHEAALTFKTDDTKESLQHCILGILTEAGEIGDAIKKHIYYGQPLDVENVIEECGDILFYINNLATTIGVPVTTIQRLNIEKLRKRYPSGFSEEHATARLDKNDGKAT
jgi:NTP pyrophosphatase (non-canonical NTP hydrolase)